MTTSFLGRQAQAVPAQYRSNFRHLYFDIAWFGVLSGSTLSFIAVYMARIGASAFQIGLFNASPAIMTLLFALPTGQWLKGKPLGKPVFWSAALLRLMYFVWIVVPVLLVPQMQLWAFIAFTLVMSIPGTMLAISFNALFADTVPTEWRAQVAGTRNALLAIAFILTSLLCGVLLEWLPFPLGYQVVFAIGFVGAAMSTVHLWFIHPLTEAHLGPRTGRSLGDLARPGVLHSLADAARASAGLRFLTRRQRLGIPRFSILRGPFGRVALVLFLFHLSLMLPQSLFPLAWVERLQLSDAEISLGNALFYVSVFIVSTQLRNITDRLSHHRVLVLGAMILVSYPTITALMQDTPTFLINSLIGGAGWSLAAGAMNNFLLENIPQEEMPAHLAWYNLTLNLAILVSSLGGPALAAQMGLVAALLFSGLARLFSALSVWRWGRSQTPVC